MHMKETLRPYRPTDRSAIIRLITQLQEHIALLDPYRRQKSGHDFDTATYVENTLKKVKEENGAIFVAEIDNDIAACIIGCIFKPSAEDLLESYPMKEGSILELIVSEKSRGSGLGSKLIKAMEDYFLRTGCTFSRVACFAPNLETHIFYGKCGYEDRNIELLKKLK